MNTWEWSWLERHFTEMFNIKCWFPTVVLCLLCACITTVLRNTLAEDDEIFVHVEAVRLATTPPPPPPSGESYDQAYYHLLIDAHRRDMYFVTGIRHTKKCWAQGLKSVKRRNTSSYSKFSVNKTDLCFETHSQSLGWTFWEISENNFCTKLNSLKIVTEFVPLWRLL